MSVRSLQWTLKVKDSASKAIKKVNDQVDKVKNGVPKMADAFSSGMGKISKSTGSASKALGNLSNKTKGISMAAGALAGAGVKSAVDFEKKLNFAGVQAGMTNKEMQELSKTIKGMDKRSTSLELLDASGVYASAGLIKDEIEGVLKATEQIARVSGDMDVASDIMLTSQVAFDLDLTDQKAVQSMGDRFAKGSALAKLELSEINETAKIAQGTFKSMNMTADDSIATTVLLAKAGYVGSSAGTMMNATYNDLIGKAEEGKVAFGDFKLSLYDTNGEMKTMPKIMEEIESGLSQMSPSEKNSALAQVFGANSQKLVSAFLGQGSDAYKEFAREVSGAEGDLQKKYDEMGQTTSERWASVKASLLDAGVSLGESMLPALESVGAMVGDLADRFSGLDEETQKAIGMAVIGTAALSPVLSLGGKVMGTFSSVTGLISDMTAEGSLLRKGIGLLGKGTSKTFSGIGITLKTLGGGLATGAKSILSFGATAGKGMLAFSGSVVKGLATATMGMLKFVATNPMMLVAVGIMAAGVLVYKNFDKIKAKATELKESVTARWNEIKENTKTAWGETRQSISDTWTSIKQTVSTPIKATVTLLKDKFESGVQSVKRGWEGLKSFISQPITATVSLARKGIGKITGKDGSHRTGLSKVPYDGYRAVLHKDEEVLKSNDPRNINVVGRQGVRQGNKTITENKEHTSKVMNFNPTININSNSSDNKELSKLVRRELELFWKKANLQYS